MGLENFKLTGSSDDGELIYVQTKLFKSFHVIYRGIVDNDFRKRHGLGDGRLRGLQKPKDKTVDLDFPNSRNLISLIISASSSPPHPLRLEL
ncbi:hypothetical protein YC2023_052456 [Brassica napus]